MTNVELKLVLYLYPKIGSSFQLLGLRPEGLSPNALSEGHWIPDDWESFDSPREQFVLGVLRRFCPSLIEKINLISCDDVITTDFALGTDPAQISIVDQLIATLVGFNWSIVGYLSCTDNPAEDRLDSPSRYEYTKARQFLETWTRAEGYRCLSIGPQSKRFRVNLFESAGWREGIFMGHESSGPNDFYQIGRSFDKRPVSDVMADFEMQIWNSASPFDFVRKVAQVNSVLTFRDITHFEFRTPCIAYC